MEQQHLGIKAEYRPREGLPPPSVSSTPNANKAKRYLSHGAPASAALQTLASYSCETRSTCQTVLRECVHQPWSVAVWVPWHWQASYLSVLQLLRNGTRTLWGQASTAGVGQRRLLLRTKTDLSEGLSLFLVLPGTV